MDSRATRCVRVPVIVPQATKRAVVRQPAFEATRQPDLGQQNDPAEIGPGIGGLVGTAGLEPATSASRTLRATKLRHVPSRRV